MKVKLISHLTLLTYITFITTILNGRKNNELKVVSSFAFTFVVPPEHTTGWVTIFDLGDLSLQYVSLTLPGWYPHCVLVE